MGNIVKFKHNGKVYEIKNNYIAVPNNETYTEEERNIAFIRKMKKEISQHNRSEAQRKKYQRNKILKVIEEWKYLGIPFTRDNWEKYGILFDEEQMKYYSIEFEEQ